MSVEVPRRSVAERRASRVERLERREMVERREAAHIFLRLEDLLSRPPTSKDLPGVITEASQLMERGLAMLERAPLSSEQRKEARDAVARYSIECQQARRWALAIEQKIHKEKMDGDEAENMAVMMFHLRCPGLFPDGKIRVFQREGYFIIACEKDTDQARLYYGKEPTAEELKNISRIIGTHHGTFYLNQKRASIRCLLIRGLPRTMDEYTEIVKHERQHFLNNGVLETFEHVEEPLPTDLLPGIISPSDRPFYSRPDIRDKHRRIKDELLARIREANVSPRRCTEFLFDPIYAFSFSTHEEREQTRELFVSIERKLEEVFAYYQTSRERGMLVNSLLDVPLLGIPKKLGQIEAFLEQEVDIFWDDTLTEANHALADLKRIPYAQGLSRGWTYVTSRLQDREEKMKPFVEKGWPDQREITRLAIGVAEDDRPVEQMLREEKMRYDRKAKELTAMAKEFFLNGIHVPLVGKLEWKEISEKERHRYERSIDKAKREILQRISLLTADQLHWLGGQVRRESRLSRGWDISLHVGDMRYDARDYFVHLEQLAAKHSGQPTVVKVRGVQILSGSGELYQTEYVDVQFSFFPMGKDEKQNKQASFTVRLFVSAIR